MGKPVLFSQTGTYSLTALVYLVASDIQFKVERDAEGHIVVFTRATAADSWHIVDGASVTMVDAAQPQPTPTPTPTTTVTVTATPTPAPVAHVPQTGDSTPLLAMVIATAAAAAGFIALLVAPPPQKPAGRRKRPATRTAGGLGGST